MSKYPISILCLGVLAALCFNMAAFVELISPRPASEYDLIKRPWVIITSMLFMILIVSMTIRKLFRLSDKKINLFVGICILIAILFSGTSFLKQDNKHQKTVIEAKIP